jgi:hypothetical protein
VPGYFSKDPDEVKDYHINWATHLGTDTIVTSTWIVPAGITKVRDSSTTTTATIWLSGGTAGQQYHLVNHITTVGGRTEEDSLIMSIGDK